MKIIFRWFVVELISARPSQGWVLYVPPTKLLANPPSAALLVGGVRGTIPVAIWKVPFPLADKYSAEAPLERAAAAYRCRRILSTVDNTAAVTSRSHTLCRNTQGSPGHATVEETKIAI